MRSVILTFILCLLGVYAYCCSGTITAGTCTPSKREVFFDSSFVLRLSGATTGTGITYQWQSSPNHVMWTNITGATDSTYFVTSITSTLFYRCFMVCTAGSSSDTSGIAAVAFVNDGYCNPMIDFASNDCDSGRGFNNFGFTGYRGTSLNDSTPCSSMVYGFKDISEKTVVVQQNEWYSTWGDRSISTIWIDLNNDGYYAADEIVGGGSFRAPFSPFSDSLIPHRMRVMTSYLPTDEAGMGIEPLFPDACAKGFWESTMTASIYEMNYAHGAAHDYTVFLSPARSCTGSVTAGRAIANTAFTTGSFSLTLKNTTEQSGIGYQWQSSTDDSTWTNITGATTIPYIASPITVKTFFRCYTTCVSSGSVDTSSPFCVHPLWYDHSDENIHYCGGWGNMVRFVWGSIYDRDSNYRVNWADRSATMETTVIQGDTIELTVESFLPYCCGGGGYSLYIDYNDNGRFSDSGEMVAEGGDMGSGFTLMYGSISTSATIGTHMLMLEGSDGGTTEARMYTIHVISPYCVGRPAAGYAASTLATACTPTSFTLNVYGETTLIGTRYQWQYSLDSTTWVDISGATSTSYSTVDTLTTYYRCVVSCSYSGLSSNSVPVRVFYVPGASAPVAGTLSGASYVCVGSTTTFTTTGSAGGVWSIGNPWLGTISSSGVITATSGGSDYVYYTVTTGCGTDVARLALEFRDRPAIERYYGDDFVCAGTTTTLTTLTSGTWSSVHTSIATVTTGGVVTGVSVGLDTIVHVISNTCGTTRTARPFWVIGPPVVRDIIGPDTLCVGSTATYTDSTEGGFWYSSCFSCDLISSSSYVTTEASITAYLPGTDTLIYFVTNTCGSSEVHHPITILAIPEIAPITGPTTVCEGGSMTLSDSISGGTWRSSSPGTATITTGGTVYGVSPGLDTVSYNTSNYCATRVATYVIRVAPLPIPGIISGSDSMCIGDAVAFSDTATGGTWSSVNTSIASVSSSGMVYGLAAGIDTIKYAITNACGTRVASKPVKVLTVPLPGTITGLSTVCEHDSTFLSESVSGGVWTTASSFPATISAIGVVHALHAGTDTVYYTRSNMCGSRSSSYEVTIAPLPNAGSIAGADSVCLGTTTTLSVSSGTGTWYTTGHHTAITTTGVVSGTTPGLDSIYYVVINSCGIDTARHLIFALDTPHAGSITGADSLCVNRTTVFSDTAGGGVWRTTGHHSFVTVIGVVRGTSPGRDSVFYVVPNSCGIDTATRVITMLDTPHAAAITGIDSICRGTTTTLSDTSRSGTWYATSHHSTTSSGGVVSGSTPGRDSVYYVVTNSCGTDTAVRFIYVLDTAFAGAVTGTDSLCAGTNSTFSSTSTSGFWRTTGRHSSISSTGVVRSLTAGRDSVYYIVANACGIDTAWHVILLLDTPHADIITGSDSLCLGTATTLSDTSHSGAWHSTGHHISISTAGRVTSISPGSDSVYYVVSNSCGFDSAILVLTVLDTPFAGYILGSDSLCLGMTTTFSDTSRGGTWHSTSHHSTITATGVVRTTTPGRDSVYYIVPNSCGIDTAVLYVTVMDTTSAGTIMGVDSFCVGTTATLTDSIGGGTWFSTSHHSTITSAGSINGTSPGRDSVYYVVSNVCGIDSTEHLITMLDTPHAGTITGADSVCLTLTVSMTDAASGGTWATATGNTSVSTTGVVTGVAVGHDTILYSVTNTCGTAIARKVIYAHDCHLGINEYETNQIYVYPNPATNAIQIQIDNYKTPKNLVLTDVQGQVLFNKAATGTVTTIDVSGVASGIYLLKVSDGSQTRIFKLVIAQ